MCAIVDILLVLVVALIVVLVWRGPSMLPQFGQALGKAVKGVRDNVNADAPPSDAPPSDVADTTAAGSAPDAQDTNGKPDA
jgi:Sec-independent protein translocase protein TatA